MDPINLEGVQFPSTLPYERDGKWYWPDETWQEHGPCSSKESAQRRQDCYCAVELEGSRQHVLAVDWTAKKDAEPPGAAHPCDVPCAWDCACSGACSCHWIEVTP